MAMFSTRNFGDSKTNTIIKKRRLFITVHMVMLSTRNLGHSMNNTIIKKGRLIITVQMVMFSTRNLGHSTTNAIIKQKASSDNNSAYGHVFYQNSWTLKDKQDYQKGRLIIMHIIMFSPCPVESLLTLIIHHVLLGGKCRSPKSQAT